MLKKSSKITLRKKMKGKGISLISNINRTYKKMKIIFKLIAERPIFMI